MKSFAAAAFAAAIGVVSAKKCQNITVPVTIQSRNGKFDQRALTPHNNIEVTNIILAGAQQGHNATAEALRGYADVSGTYHLSTTYCAPDQGVPAVVQVLTHGIGFDRSYWDAAYNNFNYSYTNVAVDQYGYATFSYDRLGIGHSEHGEPVNEIQAMLEVQALRNLTVQLRNGQIPGVPKFQKTIHIGHSFGSVQSYALSRDYPEISDGVGLTGFSQNGTFLPFFEYGGDFVQANLNSAFAQYPDGYLAPASASAVQTNFFAPNAFDPNILAFAVKTGEPVTIGELLTIGGASSGTNVVRAPVLIITGERDIPFCGGDCLQAPTGYSSIPETSKNNFPNASPFQVTIVPGTGHGLNYQYSHPYTYATINQFFAKNGVSPNGASAGIGTQPSGSQPSGAQPPAGYPHGGNGWGRGGHHGW